MHYNFYRKRFFSKGITLIELLVVIAILGILLISAVMTLNPQTQLSRADDARRRNDIQQIKNALDLYYNDHNCYPTEIPFGSRWEEGNTVYMIEVPQDPACSVNDATCYRYVVDGACPQWNVMFVKLSEEPPANNLIASCPLVGMTSCTPEGYSNDWSCNLSGSVNCSALLNYSLDDEVTAPTPTPTTATASPTPTPTIDPCPVEERSYSCSGTPNRCNVVPQGTGTYCTPACGGAC